MRDGFKPVRFECAGQNERIHSDTGERSTIDVDGIHFARGDYAASLFEDALDRNSLGRIDFDGDDELLFLDFAPELTVGFARRDTAKSFSRLEYFYGTRLDRLCAASRVRVDFLHGFGDGADVFRRSAATTANQAHSQLRRFLCKEREIFR